MAEIFTVDLGAVKLTDQQRADINASIQHAVAGHLATLGSAGKIVLVPVNKWPGGGITNGIYLRPIDDRALKTIIG